MRPGKHRPCESWQPLGICVLGRRAAATSDSPGQHTSQAAQRGCEHLDGLVLPVADEVAAVPLGVQVGDPLCTAGGVSAGAAPQCYTAQMANPRCRFGSCRSRAGEEATSGGCARQTRPRVVQQPSARVRDRGANPAMGVKTIDPQEGGHREPREASAVGSWKVAVVREGRGERRRGGGRGGGGWGWCGNEPRCPTNVPAGLPRGVSGERRSHICAAPPPPPPRHQADRSGGLPTDRSRTQRPSFPHPNSPSPFPLLTHAQAIPCTRG